VLVVLLLSLPGAACADTLQNASAANATGRPTVPATANITAPETTNTPVVPVIPPPQLVLTSITTGKNLSATVYGIATPGSINATITAVRWDWGDNGTPEYHDFPYSHEYASPGSYTISITAFQSDGQVTAKAPVIRITGPGTPVTTAAATTAPTPPPGFVIPAGAPSLTLLEPVVDRLNVTLNGNLNPGSPGVTIAAVTINWDDGNVTDYPDLPATHQYVQPGIFTINLTARQSDGLSVTKGITVDIRPGSQAPPVSAQATPPPGDQTTIFILLVVAIMIVAAGAGMLRVLLWRRRGPGAPDMQEALAVQEGIYHQAARKGDTVTAAASAHVCAQMYGSLAKKFPEKHSLYSGLEETWENRARDAGMTAAKEHLALNAGGAPADLPSQEELERICSGTDVETGVLDAVIRVAVEIAREGREGQAVGTSFVVGDSGSVLDNSRQFVLNPFHGHRDEERLVTDTGIRGNIKEFALLDGAFVITGSGVVEAAGRYLTADTSQVKVPGGLGSRHSSVAGITRATKSIGIVVSQSGGLISLFRDGKIVRTIHS
jgi:PKD repeat protein